jgi:hypothetical protein
MVRTLRALWITCVVCQTVACRDYAYRHEIRGTVLDAANQPIAGALVRRVSDKNDQYGVDELYLRTTAANGSFDFVNEGRGPSPVRAAPWRIEVEFPKGTKRTYEIVATWSDDKSECTGYCARNVVIVFRP